MPEFDIGLEMGHRHLQHVEFSCCHYRLGITAYKLEQTHMFLAVSQTELDS